MKYKLIMLPNPILVGNERIKVEDLYHTSDYRIVKWLQELEDFSEGASSYPKPIIAGIECLPRLDLSDIAEEIGWVDIEKSAQKFITDEWTTSDEPVKFGIEVGYEAGFKAAQSLNEKKYSEEDLEDFYIWKDENRWFSFSDGKWNYTFEHPTSVSKDSYEKNYRKTTKELLDMWKQQIKPKEYNVEVEMECVGWETTKDAIIKVTNNTIKVTKILS